MNLEDKLKHTVEDLGGKAKEAAGSVTGDSQLEAEGKVDQASAAIKDTLTDAKDTLADAASQAKEKAEEIGHNVSAAFNKLKEGFQD